MLSKAHKYTNLEIAFFAASVSTLAKGCKEGDSGLMIKNQNMVRERGKESSEARNATRAQRRGRGEAQKRRGRVRSRAKMKAIPQQFARAPVKEK